MQRWARLVGAFTVLFLHSTFACDILLANDDGWAGAQIRAQRDSLVNAGFNVILSSPAQDMSARGDSSAPPQPLTKPCQFNTCPTGSPAEGFNTSDTRLNYVNSFAVDAVRYGIQTLAPKIFCSPPEFVISGPNTGNLFGVGTPSSSAIAVACEATKEGIPSVAFAAGTAGKLSYTTLATSPNSRDTLSALLYAELSSNFTHALVDPRRTPHPPRGRIFEGQLPCDDVLSFKWVLTRQQPGNAISTVKTCGTKSLPVDQIVVQRGCYVAITVLNATTMLDVSAEVQEQVLERLAPSELLSCFRG